MQWSVSSLPTPRSSCGYQNTETWGEPQGVAVAQDSPCLAGCGLVETSLHQSTRAPVDGMDMEPSLTAPVDLMEQLPLDRKEVTPWEGGECVGVPSHVFLVGFSPQCLTTGPTPGGRQVQRSYMPPSPPRPVGLPLQLAPPAHLAWSLNRTADHGILPAAPRTHASKVASCVIDSGVRRSSTLKLALRAVESCLSHSDKSRSVAQELGPI